MSAGGTILFAALGGAAGAYAGAVVMEEWTSIRHDPVNAAAAGGAIGAALGAFIKVSIDAADAKEKSGTLSGAPRPLIFRGFP